MKDYTGLCIYIPKELYKKFRIETFKNDLSIKSVILDFIQEYSKGETNDKSSEISTEDETKKD